MTAEVKEQFLDAYAINGTVTTSVLPLGLTNGAVYWQLDNDPEFKEGFDKAKEQAKKIELETLEAEIKRRGLEGYDHPVIHQGIITDTYKKFSDNLLMFRTKKLDPGYRDNQAAFQLTLNQNNISLTSDSAAGSIVDQISRLTGSNVNDQQGIIDMETGSDNE
jgi:hypothetical protein